MFHGVWPRDGRISSHYYTLLLVSPTVTSALSRSDFDRTVGVSHCSRILPPNSSQALQEPSAIAAVSFNDTAIIYREIIWGRTCAVNCKVLVQKGSCHISGYSDNMVVDGLRKVTKYISKNSCADFKNRHVLNKIQNP